MKIKTIPARLDNADVLAGATSIAITITGVDADARTFKWDH